MYKKLFIYSIFILLTATQKAHGETETQGTQTLNCVRNLQHSPKADINNCLRIFKSEFPKIDTNIYANKLEDLKKLLFRMSPAYIGPNYKSCLDQGRVTRFFTNSCTNLQQEVNVVLTSEAVKSFKDDFDYRNMPSKIVNQKNILVKIGLNLIVQINPDIKYLYKHQKTYDLDKKKIRDDFENLLSCRYRTNEDILKFFHLNNYNKPELNNFLSILIDTFRTNYSNESYLTLIESSNQIDEMIKVTDYTLMGRYADRVWILNNINILWKLVGYEYDDYLIEDGKLF